MIHDRLFDDRNWVVAGRLIFKKFSDDQEDHRRCRWFMFRGADLYKVVPEREGY